MSKKLDVVLGKLCNGDEGRDAVHIAVCPVIAKTELKVGEHIGVTFKDGKYYSCSKVSKRVGIVDPFLKNTVKTGESFYLFLYPNTITSLKHSWTHPLFKDEENKNIDNAKNYLEDLAKRLEITFDRMMNDLEEYGYICLGYDTPDWVYSEKDNLKYHYKQYTGKDLSNDGFYFACSC